VHRHLGPELEVHRHLHLGSGAGKPVHRHLDLSLSAGWFVCQFLRRIVPSSVRSAPQKSRVLLFRSRMKRKNRDNVRKNAETTYYVE
jgi:hypothetical protein